MTEPAATSQARRGRWPVLAVLGIGLAALLVAIVELSTEEGGPPKVEVDGINDAQRIFGGLAQEGDRLGDSDAAITVQVFNDVQCDGCDEQFLTTIPTLVEERVRAGEVKLLYRHYSFSINPVQEGFVAAEAAGEQGYQWQYVYLLFRNQDEAERLGTVSEVLESIAASVSDLDVSEWEQAFARGGGPDGPITRRLGVQDDVARGLGLRSEPSAIVSGPAGTETLQDSPSLGQIEAAIDRVD
jgi:protein-disulfide isomerase